MAAAARAPPRRLENMSLRALQKEAEDAGVSEADEKAALVKLILSARAAAPPDCDELAAAPALLAGDRVTWTKANNDIPKGAVGVVQGPAKKPDGNVVVEFPKGQWIFPLAQLRRQQDAALARLRAKHAGELADQQAQTTTLENQLAGQRQAALNSLTAKHAAAEDTLRKSYQAQQATTPAAKLLLETPEEVAINIACQLSHGRERGWTRWEKKVDKTALYAGQNWQLVPVDSALDLLRLAIASRRYRSKTVAVPRPRGGAGSAARPPEMISIVSEAARRWLAACSEAERQMVPRRLSDSWLGLMNELTQLREPPLLSRKGKGYKIEKGSSCSKIRISRPLSCVATKAALRGGRHRARFVVGTSDAQNMMFGVIKTTFAWHANEDAPTNSFNAFYNCSTGRRFPGNRSWAGMQAALNEGDRIDMELDLEAGTGFSKGSLAVWKNEQPMGVMRTGLHGSFYWAIVLSNEQCKDDIAKIEPMPTPDAPAAAAGGSQE